ncbi:class I SAM-dependent methyltransferase [Clostridium sp. YIM B02515]|uniref:Class I SAM-dependent methyltransferase n=1 Tax=Clostridium rhizosphaerae TaxID=2803861 RepID=A0ABS1T552_9CLOT|nr:class I SAM-dependent methyltransferase [Clostridium rhizosphaerae]MBL4934468.1 class I SAM-dependent methyltransferase [Clostridium rhizosphaerae]
MDTNIVKLNLKEFYNQEAELRNISEKQEWKKSQRDQFLSYVKSENKNSLLEIGAGTGNDSQFFMNWGLSVIAIDLSSKMIRLCKEKGIEAYELDFYNISNLNKKFDCIWSMNSLLHVPKTDLPKVLNEINSVLNEKGLFYMGVYGGEDSEREFVNEVANTPRFFSSYSEGKLKEVLSEVFDIIEFEQIDVGRNMDFQAVIMRKK